LRDLGFVSYGRDETSSAEADALPTNHRQE
jgi:hypothetical protein